MYILVQDNKVTAYSDKEFNGFTKQVELSYTEYVANPEKYIFNGENFVLNPEIEKVRKESFKSQFFEIKDFGYYRKQPKGYGSAIESLNTAFNIVSISGILPADTLTFYTEPDFSKEEQCTEEWLVFNSYKNERMTAAEFGEFYAKFVTAWNNEEHK